MRKPAAEYGLSPATAHNPALRSQTFLLSFSSNEVTLPLTPKTETVPNDSLTHSPASVHCTSPLTSGNRLQCLLCFGPPFSLPSLSGSLLGLSYTATRKELSSLASEESTLVTPESRVAVNRDGWSQRSLHQLKREVPVDGHHDWSRPSSARVEKRTWRRLETIRCPASFSKRLSEPTVVASTQSRTSAKTSRWARKTALILYSVCREDLQSLCQSAEMMRCQ